jgi:glycosyltransferase involved in cell wall biosynthesis
MKNRAKIKIAFIIASLTSGGAEKQLFYLLKYIDKKKFDPYLVSFHKGIWFKKFKSIGVPIKVINYSFIRFEILIKLISFLKKNKFKIVHNYGHTANIVGRLGSILSKVPIVIAGERNSPKFIKSRLAYMIDKILSPFTSALISNSKHGKSYWVKNKLIFKNKAWVVHNGLKIKINFHRKFKNKKIFNLISIGDLNEQKNHYFLLKIVSNLIKKKINFRFTIIGDGPKKNILKERIKKLNLQRYVILKGYKLNINKELRNSDIYLHSALYEGLPNAIMEAMSMSLPCIVTNGNGCNELIKNKFNGIIVKNNNEKLFTKELLSLIKNVYLRKKYGSRAFKTINNEFSVEKFIRKNEKIYYKLFINKFKKNIENI